MNDNAPAAEVLSLTPPNAVQWNHDLMLEFQAALKKDPAGGPDVISSAYELKHRVAQYNKLSRPAKTNLKTVHELEDRLKHWPRSRLAGNFSKELRSLISSLKQLLWDSPKLWESPIRGVVVKCNEEIVAKVITGDVNDLTEYITLQYLAERAPDIPASKPYRLISFGPFRVIFMSYQT
ncbi:hypothetical protein ACJ73_03402 [Blastomyces percursus]|uniref:Uncharacterized protein n=1 Tax=Blastomyces percursus TaxID=1658174 RepID=A0A1J9R9M7_9EURO|nr:hypothetical protein ACJ73_03402 [Blastomyces percursus]